MVRHREAVATVLVGLPTVFVSLVYFSRNVALKQDIEKMDDKLERMEARMDDKLEKMEARIDDKLEKMEGRIERKVDCQGAGVNQPK